MKQKIIIFIMILACILLTSCGNNQKNQYETNPDGTITLNALQDIKDKEFVVPENYEGALITSIGKRCLISPALANSATDSFSRSVRFL